MHILIIDTETTGLPKRGAVHSNTSAFDGCRLVQIAWEKYNISGSLVSSYCKIVRPEGYTIPLASTNIHGITTADAIVNGIPLSTVLDDIENNIEDVGVIVAHNVEFDESVIMSEMFRNKRYKLLSKWQGLAKECTMKLCALPDQKWPRLAEAHLQCFGSLPQGQLHRADKDVSVCASIYWYLSKLRS